MCTNYFNKKLNVYNHTLSSSSTVHSTFLFLTKAEEKTNLHKYVIAKSQQDINYVLGHISLAFTWRVLVTGK